MQNDGQSDTLMSETANPGLPAAATAVSQPRSLLLFRHVWDRRQWIARITALGAIVAVVIAFSIPPTYRTTVQVMPPDQRSGLSGLVAAELSRAGDLGSYVQSMSGIKNSGALFVGVLNSRAIQDLLVSQFDLQNVYRVRRRADAREKLRANSAIVEDRLSGIITIAVTDRSAERAARLANAYVDALNRLVAQVSTSAARRERVFIEERLKIVKQDLDQSARALSQYASTKSAIDVPQQGKAMLDAAARLQGTVIAAESEVRGLQQIYTDDNVRVRQARARTAELQRQLDKLGGKTGTSTDELYPSLRELPQLGLGYAELYRRAKIQEVIFETLTKQYEMAKVQEAKDIPMAARLDQAEVPERRSGPPRMLIVFSGMVLCFLAATGWVLTSVWWQQIDANHPHKLFFGEMATKNWASIRALKRRSPASS